MATCRSWNWGLRLVGFVAINGAITLPGCFAIASAGGLWAIASKSAFTLAQIAPDTTLDAESSVVTPNASVDNLPAERIDGGAVRGTNLFHSFQEFNIREGQRVYFTNPAGIENILSRVTGSNPSAILGTLGVDGAANLFLLNPNGIIFGPKAQLDIAGSFFASTANRLVFDNGLEFSASNPQAPPLLTISVLPGLQYGSNHSGTISNAGNLAVGQNLTLAAGNLDLQGQLHAGSNLTLFATNTVRLRGSINSTDTSDIKAGDVTLMARNAISADNFIIDITTSGNREGGNITIETGSLFLTNGAQLIADTLGEGNAGSVNITATDLVSFDGVASSNGPSSGASSLVRIGAQGNGGDINITTRSLSVTGGAQLSANTLGQGDAGRVSINATDSVSFDGVGSNEQSSRAVSQVEAGAEGNGGNLSITTRLLSVTGGAQLSATTSGKGDAGFVSILATDSASFDGVGSNRQSSRATSNVASGAQGKGGNLSITTGSLSVTNGAQLSASTSGQGDAGGVNITAIDSISLDDGGSNGRISAISSRVNSGAEGNGGNLNITTGSLSLNNGWISSSNAGTGRAGDININARSVSLKEGGIAARTTSGQGGNISLDVQDVLLLSNDSLISTTAGTAQTGGDGGNIRINAKFIFALPKEESNISANAYEGRGGNIRITSQGIFGIEFRESRTSLSDIIASSDFGVNGVVQISSLEIDPSRGLTALPTDFVDPTGLIDHRCQVGSRSAASEFTITGRGGLPPNPNEPLGEEGLLEDFGSTPVLRNEEREDKLAAAPASVGSPPTRIVEAQGWIVDSDGKVILTAQAPTVTPQHPWQTPTACQGVSDPTEALTVNPRDR